MKCVILLLSAILFVIVEGGPLPAVHRFVEKGPEKIKKFAEGGGADGSGGEIVEGGGGGGGADGAVKEITEGGGPKFEGGGGGADGAVKEITEGGGPKLKKHVHHYKIPGGGAAKEIAAGGPKEIKKEIPGKIKKHVHHFKKGAVGGGGGGGDVGNGGGLGPAGNGGGRGHEDKITKDRGKNSKPGKGCQEGLLTGTARELDSAIKGLTSGIANTLGGEKAGLINNILRGAEAILDDTAGGLDQAVSDFFCGFNRVFNDIGTDLGKGKLLKAVGSGAITFVTGAGSFFGNLGFNAISAVVSGASKLINGPK